MALVGIPAPALLSSAQTEPRKGLFLFLPRAAAPSGLGLTDCCAVSYSKHYAYFM